MRLLIHAPNVHQGGGRTLLLALLNAAKNRPHTSAVVDARLPVPADLPESLITRRVPPGVWARLRTEWRLRSALGPEDVVLCFGNLPPLFGTRARVVLFLQNRYLVRRRSTQGLPLRTRFRNEVERAWVRGRLRASDAVIVQTRSMAEEVEQEFGVRAEVVPFAPEARSPAADHAVAAPERDLDFLYVASGEPHKNHRNLIAAWRLLARDGLRPSLGLTVSCESYPALCAEIDAGRSRDQLRIENLGAVDPSAIDALYRRSRAVVYPSRFESFGLPLVDAAAKGLSIVAAELDYVRDVVRPAETFDPASPVSIARAVRRFCGLAEPAVLVLSPAEFVDRLVAEFSRPAARR